LIAVAIAAAAVNVLSCWILPFIMLDVGASLYHFCQEDESLLFPRFCQWRKAIAFTSFLSLI
jgi:hypothetical protein